MNKYTRHERTGAVYRDGKPLAGFEIVDELNRLAQRLEATEQREQAMAAHVETCHKVMKMVDEGPEFVSAKARRGIRLVRERKPTASLARRDLLKQAEVLGECADYGDRVGVDYWQGFLRTKAAELHRQAEEGKS